MTTRQLLSGLGLAVLMTLPLGAAPASFPYRLTAEPERPLAGESFTIVLEIDGLSEAALGQVKASPGFDLGLSLARPSIGRDGSARGSRLSLEFKVSGQGPWTIQRLEVKGKEGSLVLGPLSFQARAQVSPGQAQAARNQAWVWIAPDKVYRYSSFALGLELLAGGDTAPPSALAIFPPPEGGSLEALPGTALSWTATALAAGSMDLPAARVEAGSLSGKAPAARIEVLPLPREIEASRAIGDFSLDLELPPQTIVREGDSLLFRLILEGRGNLPSVILPKPQFSLNGRALAPDLVSQRRRDSLRPVQGGYEGSIVLELVLEAPGPGSLSLQIPALSFISLPSGDVTSLGPKGGGLRILPKAGKADGSDPFAARLPGLAKALSGYSPDLASLPALVAKARYSQALALIAASPVGVKTSAEARTLEACLLWLKGEKGRALALVYGLARRHEGGAQASALAREASVLVGAGKPASKLLPRALYILVSAAAFLLGFLAFLLAGRRGPSQGARRPLLKGAAGLCLLTALGLLVFAGASVLEDGADYAVVWTDTLVSVPSPLAEGREIVVKGSSARVIGTSPDYVGLRLEDNRVGWALRDSVYLY